jgi:hypothetical protein
MFMLQNLIEQMVKTEKNIGIEKIEEQIRKGFKMNGIKKH